MGIDLPGHEEALESVGMVDNSQSLPIVPVSY
jgi:hypothetical protein